MQLRNPYHANIVHRLRSLFFFLAAGRLFGAVPFSLDHAVVGIYAVDSRTKKELAEKNSSLSMMPSSCMKIVTSAAALRILGPDARFETLLQYDGKIENGILRGNLLILGGGDPCLGSERASLYWKEQIHAWAKAIQNLGIRKIEGRIIADASKWEKALAVPSWLWEDLGNYYGAGACALTFHENAYSLYFKPGKVGEKALLLRTEPPVPIAFQNEVATGPEGSGDQACIYGSEFSPVQFLRGTIPAAVEEFPIKGTIPDPPAFVAALLAEEVKNRGIVIAKQELSRGPSVTFHTTYSPPIKEIVYWTNQKSINLYAEHLLKKMGETLYKEGSTAAGIRAVSEYWRSQNIDLSGFHMEDGSGLSRKNLITAKQLVSILINMKNDPLFCDSLPEPHPSVKAKSGSMSFAKCYAGYAKDTVFAVLVNQCCDPPLMNKKLEEFLTNLTCGP